MADETPNGQAPEGNEGGQAPPEPKVFDEEYVKSLRAEAAKYRKEAQAAAAKVATFETERMTEAERLRRRQKRLRTRPRRPSPNCAKRVRKRQSVGKHSNTVST